MFAFLDFLRGRSKRKTSRDKRSQHQEVDFDKLIMISENVASGMAELVRLGVVHRDLAARNVMIDQWLQVSSFYVCLFTHALYNSIDLYITNVTIYIWHQAKVGDFGLARAGTEYQMEMEDELGNTKKVIFADWYKITLMFIYFHFSHHCDALDHPII